jgi:hypothetical protein
MLQKNLGEFLSFGNKKKFSEIIIRISMKKCSKIAKFCGIFSLKLPYLDNRFE